VKIGKVFVFGWDMYGGIMDFEMRDHGLRGLMDDTD
jgi:hypothetical protein